VHFCYNGLWKLLIDKGMKKKDLILRAGISSSTIAKMVKSKPVDLEVLGRICLCLGCQVGDLVEIQRGDFQEK
jgi:DNA-binding Xre family transcriptional regulator